MRRIAVILTALALAASTLVSCGIIKKKPAETTSETKEAAATETKGSGSDKTTDASTEQTEPATGSVSDDESGKQTEPVDETTADTSQSPGGAGRSTTDVTKYGTKYTPEELAALENNCKGWGPGTNVDEYNRPAGAVYYQSLYGKYDADFIIENNKAIFLTFDCGYENGNTEKIIDTLNEKGAKGVFFCTLDFVKNNGEIVQKMIDGGHIVGNHSVKHVSMPSLSVADMENEIIGVHEYVKENFGYEMFLFRPPMGEFSERSLAAVQNLGYRTVEWSFAYADWDPDNQMDPAVALEKVKASACPGEIVLLHAVSATNAAILGDAIDAFRQMGFELKTYAR